MAASTQPLPTPSKRVPGQSPGPAPLSTACAPLTSEPPLADAAPLTSEPTARGTAGGPESPRT